jgi:hypothetical protein
MFPTETFRRSFDALDAALPERKADIEYLRILHLAATTMESEVERVLGEILTSGAIPNADVVKKRVAPQQPTVPDLPAPIIDLGTYDELLEQSVEALA